MSIYDKTDHIDQLAQWWENAEDAPASPGDRIIERHVSEDDGDIYYTVGVHREGMRGLIGKSGTRILARAPKPAWHGAVAVMARLNGAGIRHALIRDGRGRWITMYGGVYMALELSDVTPLIEAKVTGEMVTRAHIEMMRLGLGDYSDRTLTSILTAALGIEEWS